MMTDLECPLEHEVAEAIEAGRWPTACGADLVSHASSCGVCRDVAAVAGAIHDDYERLRAAAPLPSAGLVWWRAQLRSRHQSVETAGRAITWAQGAGGLLAAGVLFVLGGLLWPQVEASAATIGRITLAAGMGGLWLPIALAAGAWVVLAPVVLLVVLSDD